MQFLGVRERDFSLSKLRVRLSLEVTKLRASAFWAKAYGPDGGLRVAGSFEAGVYETCFREINLYECGSFQCGIVEIGLFEIRSQNAGVGHRCVREIGTSVLSFLDPSAIQVGSDQATAFKIGPFKPDLRQIKFRQIHVLQVSTRDD